MRYSQKIIFVYESSEKYNEETGDYEQGEIQQVECLADVTDEGIQHINLLYGGLVEGAKIVRTKSNIPALPDYVLINNEKYIVKTKHTFRQDESYHIYKQ